MSKQQTLGFIGLGVMGEAMCRNLAKKSGATVLASDKRSEPLERLARDGITPCRSVADVAAQADIVFLSLPGREQVREVALGEGGLLAHAGAAKIVVDTSTAPVALARHLAARFGDAGIGFADAPVARTRVAAARGELSIMVGAEPDIFARIAPILGHMGSDITHCGPVGAGQTVKLMNNMVLFQTVVALAEALTVGRRAGVDGSVLFETLAKGSADSFALRNHGMNSLLQGVFPEQAFSTEYALKDLSYALELAADGGVTARGAALAAEILRDSARRGHAHEYFPALIDLVETPRAPR